MPEDEDKFGRAGNPACRVHLGGFSAAAKKLHRSQSTISYAIDRLEEQLGVELFEMRGRKAYLTEIGRALLAEAEPCLAGFRQIEERAQLLSSEEGLEIRLSVDSLFPADRLFAAVTEVARRFPYVRPMLRQSTFLSADTEFSVHNAQLCVSAIRTSECFLQPLMEVRMQAVARKDHPIAHMSRKLTRIDMMQHTLIVIETDNHGRKVQQPKTALQRFLPVATIDAAVAAVRAGAGFAWLPIYRINDQLQSGELVPLQLQIGGIRQVPLNLVWRDPGPMQPELGTLAALLGSDTGIQII